MPARRYSMLRISGWGGSNSRAKPSRRRSAPKRGGLARNGVTNKIFIAISQRETTRLHAIIEQVRQTRVKMMKRNEMKMTGRYAARYRQQSRNESPQAITAI